MTRSILGPAHGTAADGGARLVAEAPPLKDLTRPPNAADTATGLALAKSRGRPFQIGNTAAANRGPSLTRVNHDPGAPEDHRRVHRKAHSLCGRRRREMTVENAGVPLSSAVLVELVAWARATAWAEHFDRAGDPVKAVQLAEKASGHQLKAIGIAEREREARTASQGWVDPLANWMPPTKGAAK